MTNEKPTYTYDGTLIRYGETRVIEKWSADVEGVLALIAKANAADEVERRLHDLLLHDPIAHGERTALAKVRGL